MEESADEKQPAENSNSNSKTNSNPGEFEFYVKFAKPLVFSLPDPPDRVLAAAWIKKLKNDDASEDIRIDYLKLLLFMLHRKKLIGPFLQNPGDVHLTEFSEGTNIVEVAHELIVAENNARIKRIQNRLLGAGDFPPYAIEVSADALEYASTQDIPRFGVHAFYALSTEPIHLWDNTDNGILPKELIAESMKHAVGITSSLSLKPTKSKSLIESPKATSPKPAAKSPKQPSSPRGILGIVSCEKSERRAITWGSNLIEVTDPPLIESDETDLEHEDNVSLMQTQLDGQKLTPFDAASPPRLHEPIKLKPTKLNMNSPHKFDDSVAAMLQVSPATQYRLSPPLSPSPKKLAPVMISPITGASTMSPPGTRRGIIPPAAAFPSPISTNDSMYVGNLMDTSFPLFYDSFSGSPKRKSPKPLSPLAPGFAQTPQGPTQITINIQNQEAREILQEANVSMAEQEDNIQQQRPHSHSSPSQFDPYYKHKRRDMPATPPMFSRYRNIREGPGRTAVFTPGQFGLSADEVFEPSADFSFQMANIPFEKPTRFQYKPGERPFEDLFPDFVQDESGETALADQEPELADLDILDEDLHDDLEDQIRRIQEYYALESESLPANAGVAITTPSVPITPIRRNDYGVEFPLFEEGMPEMFSPEKSPSSKARAQMRRLYEGQQIPPHLRSPEPDPFGLPALITDYPSPVKLPSPEKIPTPLQPHPPLAKSPPKQKSTKKGLPMVQRTEEEVTQAAEEQYLALYNSLISDERPQTKTPKPSPFKTPMRSPKKPLSPQTPPFYDVHPDDLFGVPANVPYTAVSSILDSDVPPGLRSPIKPPTKLFGWQTPPHLRIEKPKPPSPYRPYHLGTPMPEDYLWNEEVPEGLFSPDREPPTPPRGPEPMSYDDYLDPFQYVANNESYGIFQEEEPLRAQLQAHAMLPYRRKFSVKVGVQAKPVKVPRRSTGPRESPILEEAELYYLGSPATSPQQPLMINYGEPYMLPSSAPQRGQGYYQSPSRGQQGVTGSPTSTQRSPAQQAPTTNDTSILTDANEHFESQLQDPQQQELLQHVVHLVEDVEGQDTDFQYISGYAQDSLHMASPPKEFAEVEYIDAAPAPKSPLKYPALQNQPLYDFVDPIEEFMPEFGPLDIGGPYDMGILEETVPFDPRQRMVKESPERPISPQHFDRNDFMAETQNIPKELYTTAYHWVRRDNSAGPLVRALPRPSKRTEKMIPIKELSPSADPDMAPFYYNIELGSNRQRYKEFIDAHRKSVSTVFPSKRLPARRKMQTLTEEVEIDSPVKQGGRPGRTKHVIKKRINFDQAGGSPEPPKQPTDYNLLPPQVIPEIGAHESYSPPKTVSPTSQRIANMMERNKNLPPVPRSPPPDDLMGVEGHVTYTPKSYLIDEDIEEQNLQSPMRLPITIPGWSTPEHLKIQRTPPISSPMPWLAPVRYPQPITQESRPEFFDNLSPHRPEYNNQNKYYKSPIKSSPMHKTTVSEIFQAQDGTTSRTIETIEETSPPHTMEHSPDRRQVENFRNIADQQYAALSQADPSTPRGQQIPRTQRYSRTPESPNAIWKAPFEELQPLDTISPPQMHEYMDTEVKSPGPQMQIVQQLTIPQQELDELTYHPQADHYLVSPDQQYKSPGIKKTTIIHEKIPLLDRVEKIVEDIEIEPETNMPPMSPEMQFQWQSPPRQTPPRPDWFDEGGYGHDLESEPFPDMFYESPKTQSGPSPHTDAYPSRRDWTPPSSGQIINDRYSPELPSTGDYEELAFEEFPNLYSSPVSPGSQMTPPRQASPGMSPGTAAELAGIRHEVSEHDYTPRFMDKTRPTMRKNIRSGQRVMRLGKLPPMGLSIMAEIEEPPDSPRRTYRPPLREVREEQLLDLGYSPQQEQELNAADPEMQALQIHQAADAQYAALMDSEPSTTITTVREVVEYGAGHEGWSILDQPHPLEENLQLQPALFDPDRLHLQWSSPPREQLPTFQRYTPPPMQLQSPLTPPGFGQNIPQHYEGLDEVPPELFGTPIRRAELFDEEYDGGFGLGGVSPQLMQSPQFEQYAQVSPQYTTTAQRSPRTPNAHPRLHQTPPSGQFAFSPSMPEAIRFEEETVVETIAPRGTPKRVEYVDDQALPPRRRPRRIVFGDMPPGSPSPLKQPSPRQTSPTGQARYPTSHTSPAMQQKVMSPIAQAMLPMAQRHGTPVQSARSPHEQYEAASCENPTCSPGQTPDTAYEEYEDIQMFGGDYNVDIHDTSDIPMENYDDTDFSWI